MLLNLVFKLVTIIMLKQFSVGNSSTHNQFYATCNLNVIGYYFELPRFGVTVNEDVGVVKLCVNYSEADNLPLDVTATIYGGEYIPTSPSCLFTN